MSTSLSIIIVEKTGILRQLNVKNYNENELYKKCGFKKEEGFEKQCEWQIKLNKQKYLVKIYGKTDGKFNMENKYDFPPPIDNTILFGSCALVCLLKDESNKYLLHNLNIELWNKLYEKLFGGFEDLTLTNKYDEEEEDELENIPENLKTKTGGYLKDGFVVDSNDEDDENDECLETENTKSELDEDEDEDGWETLDDADGSELSEEEYV
jgi:hypothetical protein